MIRLSESEIERRRCDLFDTCPDCKTRYLIVENLKGDAVFRCLQCESVWRYSMAYASKILPVRHTKRRDRGDRSDRVGSLF